ncbi:MAG TPA: hypothetical protein VFZ66_09855 [Herpetosiphonaceae bacterium]
MSVIRRSWLWLVAVLVLVSAFGFLLTSRTMPAAASGPIVLISGRDDHGLLAQATVALVRAPGSAEAVAQIADATVVRVLDERGEWLRVQTIASPQQSGWINDYHLRDRALWTAHGVQVTFVDARMHDEQVAVAVRPIDSTAAPTWVAASELREVGARDEHGHKHHTP